ncbi:MULTISPECIES: DUF4307 domain-containing protein [Gordonia]|uniref:DUF4307 domain-containing protein n=2 Tax=Gordonia TaxID=2053 RepID=L7LNC5_9ACTN|nr:MULTISPECIES: DUF4307 domain-containing protein [Gordonia]AUH69657.1 DUF4307 domain-containing protein [Gordonia sp. YC-JH1]KJR09365.1 hypothetical protein UG54_04870 [Gordonia sihwensis]KXT57484.1 hypothetical protein Y710_08605 [Gordonia sp. QH-12]MBY4570286.1 hypothetical protein [Gordonia sihwensis]WFN93764.1 DUF4307 domain-containing protein [Gordonia sihwensis]
MSTSDGGADQQKPRSGPRATYPADRSRSSKRRWFYGLAVLVVVAGVGIAYLGFRQFGDPDVSGQATGYELLSSDRVAVQYTVNRNSPDDAVVCIVRARAKDGAEVGRREVLVPAGTEVQVGARTEVATSRPPVIGEVFGCTLNVPPYLSPNA